MSLSNSSDFEKNISTINETITLDSGSDSNLSSATVGRYMYEPDAAEDVERGERPNDSTIERFPRLDVNNID